MLTFEKCNYFNFNFNFGQQHELAEKKYICSDTQRSNLDKIQITDTELPQVKVFINKCMKSRGKKIRFDLIINLKQDMTCILLYTRALFFFRLTRATLLSFIILSLS